MIYDFHSHTSLSDGQLSPVEIISEAHSRGYKVIGITDHAGIGFLFRLLQETSKDCTLTSSHWDITAVPGVELTHLPPDAIATTAKLARDAGAKLIVIHGETITENVKPGTNLAAVKSHEVDILAHPGLLTIEEAKLAAANDIYIEISARKGHAFTNGHVVKIAKLAGAKLLVNSDSHDTGDLLTDSFARKVALGSGLVESELETVLYTNPKLLLEKIQKRY
ncbi:MAG: histidinol phosphate phosphatase domain-containing protein [Chloroflexi bacterium]|nr:histidinol phosphate phosphatase domain-containing protein [Chloroflexota bacterium]